MAGIEIARFRPRHLRRILAIERACFPEDPYTRAIFRELYRDAGPLFLVAKVRRRIVAYMIACVCEDGAAELVSVAVLPDFRRQGVAAAMLEFTCAALRNAGVTALELMVRKDNTAAQRFYLQHGFRRLGLSPRYYGDGAPGVRMRLSLRK
jgi:ribosomal-protein-alanine N-acetyltransferase